DCNRVSLSRGNTAGGLRTMSGKSRSCLAAGVSVQSRLQPDAVPITTQKIASAARTALRLELEHGAAARSAGTLRATVNRRPEERTGFICYQRGVRLGTVRRASKAVQLGEVGSRRIDAKDRAASGRSGSSRARTAAAVQRRAVHPMLDLDQPGTRICT